MTNLTPSDLASLERYYNSFSYSKGLKFSEICDAQKAIMSKSLGYKVFLIKERRNKANENKV